jgi:tetrahydromethanopterin S-methyltransferase subunit H
MIYVDIFGRLKKAIDLGFDFQAIVYEYSILEDRVESILKIANKETTAIGIQKKLNIMKNSINEKIFNKYFDLSLINKIEAGKIIEMQQFMR